MRLRLLIVLLPALCLGWGTVLAQAEDVDAYLERGRLLEKQGKYDQALPYYLLALEMAETRSGADSAQVVPLLESLAGLYAEQRAFDDAEPFYRRSLSIQERELARYRQGIARTLVGLARVYDETGREDEARKLYERVLRDWQPLVGEAHPSVRIARERLAALAPPTPAVTAEAKPPVPPPAPEEAPAPLPKEPRAEPVPKPEPVPEPKPEPAPPRKAPPPPTPAAKPKEEPPAARLPRAPTYRIHLTSIRNPSEANREWTRLNRLYGRLLADLELAVTRVDLPQKGVYYRIQGGPLDRAAARARCGRFAARGVWCEVLRASGTPAQAAAPPEPPRPPVARPAAPQSVEAAPQRGYRIHLTSIRHAEDAAREWARLKKIYRGLLTDLNLFVERVDLATKGIYYRIEGGVLDRATARRLCAEFATRDVWCRVVPPGGDRAEGLSQYALQRTARRRPQSPRGTWRPSGAGRRRRARALLLRPDPGTRRHPRWRG